jgi:hypothetical protein
MTETTLLGSSPTNSMTFGLDQISAPGALGEITIKAIFAEGDNDDPLRFEDTSERTFSAHARLSSNPPEPFDFNGELDANRGSSLLCPPEGTNQLEVEFPMGGLKVHANLEGKLSLITADVAASSISEARQKFLSMINVFLDRLAYMGQVPIHISIVVVHDITHAVQCISFASPPRVSTISAGETLFRDEMAPIYALYREAMNASSPYYRVLCFNKILEGLLGPLRTELRKRANAAQIDLGTIKDLVPHHKDISSGLRHFSGTPLKQFYDTFLSKRFRDAMAHFTLKRGQTLNVSSPLDYARFTEVAFIGELCARQVIAKHEEALALLDGAQPAQFGGAPQGVSLVR